jgi:hypothetical protein
MRPRAVKHVEEVVSRENRPSPERLRQSPVERLDGVIADIRGAASRPYRSLDTLAVMERRGSITAGMRQAGEDFRVRFATAHLDPLRALDPSQLLLGDRPSRGGDKGPGLHIEAARDAVWRAIQAVGGITSPAGSCVWHVVGWESSLKAWAIGQGWNGRRVSQEAASGILIAALGALEAHLGSNRSMRKSHITVDKSGSI